MQYMIGHDGRGIGSVTVHPSKEYFAVAEKGVGPNIYIYKYPSMDLIRVLRKVGLLIFTVVGIRGSHTTQS